MLRRGLSSVVGLFAAALIVIPTGSSAAEPCESKQLELVSAGDVIDLATVHIGHHGTFSRVSCRQCFGFKTVNGFVRPSFIASAADYENLSDGTIFPRFFGFPFVQEHREQAGESESHPVEIGGLRGRTRYVSTTPRKIEASKPEEGFRFIEFYVSNACGVLMGQVIGWPGEASEANDRALNEIVRSLNVVEITAPPAPSPPPEQPPRPFTLDDLKQLLKR